MQSRQTEAQSLGVAGGTTSPADPIEVGASFLRGRHERREPVRVYRGPAAAGPVERAAGAVVRSRVLMAATDLADAPPMPDGGGNCLAMTPDLRVYGFPDARHRRRWMLANRLGEVPADELLGFVHRRLAARYEPGPGEAEAAARDRWEPLLHATGFSFVDPGAWPGWLLRRFLVTAGPWPRSPAFFFRRLAWRCRQDLCRPPHAVLLDYGRAQFGVPHTHPPRGFARLLEVLESL